MSRTAHTSLHSVQVGSDRSSGPSDSNRASSPLIHQISAKDWHELPSHARSAPDHKDLTITDIETDKATIVDKNASEENRAKAALELYESGIKEFKCKDSEGKEHSFKLESVTEDGRNKLKIDDGNGYGVSFDYVEDEHGIWHAVPHQSVAGTNGQPSDGAGRHASAPARGGRADAGHASSAGGGGGGSGGGSGGGAGGERVPHSRPRGMNYSAGDANGVGHYNQPGGGSTYNPTGSYDHHVWQGVKNTDGSVAIKFNGCQVDTDGSGAHNHPEDPTRQSQTSLRLSNGQSLDTDRDNFFVLPPSVARAYGIKKGDLGWLVQEKTGKAVPVVFGDAGPEGKLGEASVHALQSLGFNVNGRSGVDKSEQFKVVFVPGSGDGTGDIASDASAMAAKLVRTGKTGGATQVA